MNVHERNIPQPYINGARKKIEEEVLPDLTVAIATSGPVLTLNIPESLWKAMGRPVKVDVVGTVADGLKLVRGKSYTVFTNGLCKRINIGKAVSGLSAADRSTVRISAAVERGLIHLDTPIREWLEAHQEYCRIPNLSIRKRKVLPTDGVDRSPIPADDPPPSKARQKAEDLFAPKVVELEKAPESRVLEDLTPKVVEVPDLTEGYIEAYVRENGAGVSLIFAVPMKILKAVGSPERILITGNAEHGFTLTPHEYEGLKLSYGSGKSVYITTSAKRYNISKEVRLPVSLQAEAKDGVIKTGGAAPDWIKAQGLFRPKPKVMLPPPPPPAPAPIPATTIVPVTNGHANGNGHYQLPAATLAGAPHGEIDALMGRLNESLGAVLTLKGELEKRTGLKFSLASNMKFVLNTGV